MDALKLRPDDFHWAFVEKPEGWTARLVGKRGLRGEVLCAPAEATGATIEEAAQNCLTALLSGDTV